MLPARLFAGGALASILIVAAGLWLAEKPDRVRKPLPEMTLMAAPAVRASVAEEAKPVRLVYRNSVIPGGAHGAAELAAALQRDPVAAAHYANFDVAAAHVVQVGQSRLVHVSYRIGDQIYWTKKKVLLAPGEELLSDGTHLARTRCGNRIADEPEGPVLDNEPAPEVLDAAFVSSGDLIDQAPGIATEIGGRSGAAAMVAASATAATAAQAFDTRIASNMQGVAMVPATGLFGSANPRTPAQLALAQTIAAISLAPALTERFDPVVPDDPATAGTAGTVGGGTPQETSAGSVPTVPFDPKPLPPTTPTSTATATSIPEPGSPALFGLALISLTLVRRRAGQARRR